MNVATIQMLQVDSSTIALWGHDPRQNLLKVRFVNGGTYQYQNVTTEVWEVLKAGESAGSTFHQVIKRHPGLYPYTKLD